MNTNQREIQRKLRVLKHAEECGNSLPTTLNDYAY